MGKIALLFLGGAVKNVDILKAGEFDFVCCADSGLDSGLKFGIFPDIVIGDMDSVSSDGATYIKQNEIVIMKHPIDKNYTDGELAIDYLLSHKFEFSQIKIVGLVGGRPDHTYGNYHLLNNKKNTIPITAFADGFKIQVLKKGQHNLTSRIGAIVSIFALNKVAFIKLDGLKYQFAESLDPLVSRCISNISSGSFLVETDSDILVFIQTQV